METTTSDATDNTPPPSTRSMRAGSTGGLAVAAKGFRPFFLLAGIFAIAILPAWLWVLFRNGDVPALLSPIDWHAHEMIFGFTVAVIAGFLLTAVGNWTKREAATGAPLLALAGLWLAGRLAMTFGRDLPSGLPAVVDLAFLPALVFVLARPLVAAKSRRNFVMLALLEALFAANVVVHMESLGLVSMGWAHRASVAAVDVVILVIVVITGRVVPMFTRNTTGITTIRGLPRLDAMTALGMAALAVLDVAAPTALGTAVLAGVVAAVAAARMATWGTRHAFRAPLLWILHVGYAWIPVGLALRLVSALDPAVPVSLATHALTVGAIGSLTLGMMARVSLGHTGRPIVASKSIAIAFGIMTAATLARVVTPLVNMDWYRPSLIAAGSLWTVAFVVFVVVYAPILTSPRVDGKPG